MNNIQGWINLYKPKNISSFKALNKLKKKFFIKKIGHAGTLDPFAEGILPIAIGKTTKLIPFITKENKKYNFTISWGTQTDSDDSTGEIMFKSEMIPHIENIKLKLNKFLGNTFQVPPRISANKINGKRAYKLVRQNVSFKLLPKKVYVKNIRITNNYKNKTSFEIECGKGFYIRSLGRDLALSLGTYGHICHLERLNVGKFSKETSILLDDLLKISKRQELIDNLYSSVSMLDDILAYEIEKDNDLKNLSLGRSINIDEKKLFNFSTKSEDKNEIFLSHNGDIVSIGKLIGSLFKPNKVLI
tara:strand:+ start:116 stop:1021 length:906 start_codon:yes stop_codon:yes gene_type:complete